MVEQWCDITGYEGYYQVSNLGRVRSVDRVVPHVRHGRIRVRGRILQLTSNDKSGHLAVNLCKERISRTNQVHRLVAVAFIGPCPDGQQVRHGSNGVTDNSVSNLCYGTPSEDCLDKRRDGTHGGRPVRRSDGTEFINLQVAAEETKCKPQSIWKVCNGRCKTAGGYDWEYI